MEFSDTINELIDSYIFESQTALSNAKFGDGLFGLGNDPRRDPCHMKYYEDMENVVADMILSSPSEEEAFNSVSLLLKAPIEKPCPSMAQWTLIATQKMAIPLISYLSQEHRDELRKWFDSSFPRRTRLPVQKDVFKELIK